MDRETARELRSDIKEIREGQFRSEGRLTRIESSFSEFKSDFDARFTPIHEEHVFRKKLEQRRRERAERRKDRIKVLSTLLGIVTALIAIHAAATRLGTEASASKIPTDEVRRKNSNHR